MDAATPSAMDVAGQIEALRAAGAPRRDAVRFRHIEALARRAAAHQGEARRQLDERLAGLLAACHGALAQAPPGAGAARPPPPGPGALGQMLANYGSPAAAPGSAPRPAAAQAPVELKTVTQHRGAWSRLSVEHRLTQALAKVPGNAGPLNTQRLLHQAMTALRDVSPGYVHRVMAQVEALLWLDGAGPAAPPPRKADRPARPGPG